MAKKGEQQRTPQPDPKESDRKQGDNTPAVNKTPSQIAEENQIDHTPRDQTRDNPDATMPGPDEGTGPDITALAPLGTYPEKVLNTSELKPGEKLLEGTYEKPVATGPLPVPTEGLIAFKPWPDNPTEGGSMALEDIKDYMLDMYGESDQEALEAGDGNFLDNRDVVIEKLTMKGAPNSVLQWVNGLPDERFSVGEDQLAAEARLAGEPVPERELDSQDVERIQSTAAKLDMDQLVSAFYQNLFDKNPGIEDLFASTNMATQKKHLGQTLAVLVNSASNPSALTEALTSLGRRHAAYGAKPEHYVAVGTALISALAQQLEPKGEWDAWTEGCWTRLYTVAANIASKATANSLVNPH